MLFATYDTVSGILGHLAIEGLICLALSAALCFAAYKIGDQWEKILEQEGKKTDIFN